MKVEVFLLSVYIKYKIMLLPIIRITIIIRININENTKDELKKRY